MSKISVNKAITSAKLQAKKGNVAEAKKLYMAVLKAFPLNKRAQEGLAALDLDSTLSSNQDPPNTEINELLKLYNQGQFSNTEEKAESLTLKYPGSFLIWNILGVARYKLGQAEAAFEAFKKTTELNRRFADGFNNLGSSLSYLGRFEEAIIAFNQALSLKRDNAETYYNLGNALKSKDRLKEAIKAYKKATALRPNYSEAYNNLGKCPKKKQ